MFAFEPIWAQVTCQEHCTYPTIMMLNLNKCYLNPTQIVHKVKICKTLDLHFVKLLPMFSQQSISTGYV